jgi:hypothetical protein
MGWLIVCTLPPVSEVTLTFHRDTHQSRDRLGASAKTRGNQRRDAECRNLRRLKAAAAKMAAPQFFTVPVRERSARGGYKPLLAIGGAILAAATFLSRENSRQQRRDAECRDLRR